MRCLFSSSYLISEETIKRNGEQGTSTEKGKMKKWEQTVELKIEPVTARVRLLAVQARSRGRGRGGSSPPRNFQT